MKRLNRQKAIISIAAFFCVAGCVNTGMTRPAAPDLYGSTALSFHHVSGQSGDQAGGRSVTQFAPRLQPAVQDALMHNEMVQNAGAAIRAPHVNPTPDKIQAWIKEGVIADYIVIQKRAKLLTLWSNGNIIKVYNIRAFGADPVGHKLREGDEKTPEGEYTIDTKHVSQRFQKFLRISYPNKEDAKRAKSLGFSPGGQVGIHGDEGGFKGFMRRFDPNWTDGCVTVRNSDLEEIWQFVPKGTKIVIKPD